MLKTSAIAASVLALLAPAVMAQNTISVPDQANGVNRQQAMAPVMEDRTGRTFIHDEYGNLYDGRGELITARPLKLKR
jgi:hypothetical protein